MESKKIGVIVGSLRKESLNRKMALAIHKLVPPHLTLQLIEIQDLSLYNQDLDATPPAAWEKFRAEVKACDAILFVSPEYNRSIPGALKNAIDIATRPDGKNVWNAKPAMIVTVSPGAAGGVSCTHHLRQTLTNVNMYVMPQPEVAIGRAGDLFGPAGEINNESTKKFILKFVDAMAAWISKVS